MASPFAVFRKNQQTLLVLLFILAMFAFIILGNLSSQTLDLPLLGMLIGTLVLTVIGVGAKKPMQYAAVGAVGGWLAGYVAVWSGFDTPSDSIVVKSSVGDLDEREVAMMIQQRRSANDFLARAIFESLGEENRMMVQDVIQRYAFQMNGTVEQQMALGLILRKEADKLGVTVDTKAVTDYIQAATQKKLTKEKFQEILSGMKISEHKLYEIIADELKVKTTMELLAPFRASTSTPVRLWENYNKLNVTQSLQVVAVPVDAFHEKIPEPSNDELQAFFEQYKEAIPGYPEPSAIGFLQPRKIQLAYLEASYLDVEGLVAQVTEEEIEKYYEDNKDILFLNRRVPDFSRGELIEPDENSGLPNLDQLIPSDPGESKSAPDKSTEAKSPTDSEDAPSEPKGTAPELPKPEVNDESPSNDTKEEPKEESSALPPATNLQKVSFLLQNDEQAENPQPENAEEKADSGDQDKPVEKPTVPPEPEKPSLNVPPAPEAPSKNVPPAPDAPVGEQPLVAEKPQPKYQPLDSALRDRIRDQILNVRTREKQKELANLVYEEMTELSNEYFQIGTREFEQELTKPQADKARLKFIEEAREQLKLLAEKHGLNYAETPLLDAREMMSSGEHPIGSAVIGDDPGADSNQSVTDKMFGGSPESVYEAERATSLDLNSSFAFWKTADVESHVPEFGDDGIREQVLEAWIELKSRPLAEERAKELEARLEKAEAPWSEVLADETITGGEEGLVLSTRTTGRFSWMRTRSVPAQFGMGMNFGLNEELAELSTISGVEPIDGRFMKTVFHDMKEGDIGVIPNVDQTVYYVVKVQDRRPTEESAKEAAMNQFMVADLYRVPPFNLGTGYSQLTEEDQRDLFLNWRNSLLEQYDVKFRETASR